MSDTSIGSRPASKSHLASLAQLHARNPHAQVVNHEGSSTYDHTQTLVDTGTGESTTTNQRGEEVETESHIASAFAANPVNAAAPSGPDVRQLLLDNERLEMELQDLRLAMEGVTNERDALLKELAEYK